MSSGLFMLVQMAGFPYFSKHACIHVFAFAILPSVDTEVFHMSYIVNDAASSLEVQLFL